MDKKIGLSVILLVGIMCAPAQAAETSEDVISPEALRELQLKNAELILWDARDKSSFDAVHIQGATLPLPDVFYEESALYAKGLSPKQPESTAALKEVTRPMNKGKHIVTYCNSNCRSSQMLLTQLKGLGFTHVNWMEAGLQVWQEKGYPVEIGTPKLKGD